jgi:translation initiation factor 4E
MSRTLIADDQLHSEIMKRILSFPPDTSVQWKSHDSSMQQRSAIEESRRDKHHHHNDKRSSKQQGASAAADDHKNGLAA